MSKKFLKDGLLLLIAKLFSILSGTLVVIFVARYYGINIYGQYTTAIAFSTFILTFTDLGFDVYMLKECSRDKTELSKYYSNIIIIKCLILFLSVIIILFLSIYLGYNYDIIKLIILLLPNLIINYIINTFFVIMQIENKLDVNAKIQILQNILIGIVVTCIIIFKLDIYMYAILQSSISILILILYIFIIPVKFKPYLKNTKTIIKGSILFGVSSLLYIIYYKLDTVMLSLLKGTYEVGIYESAYKIINIIISMICILDNLFMPKLFKLYKTDKNKMIEIYELLLKYGVILGIPISTVLMYLGQHIINILYGKEYSDAVVIFKILVWSISIRLLSAIVGFVITASDNMVKKVKFQFCFAVLNIILNSILIPVYSVKGAAIATIITELMVFMSYFIFVKKTFKKSMKIPYVIRSVLANLLLILILHFFNNINFIGMLCTCAFFYILLISIFFKKELIYIFKLLVKKNNVHISE